ncbi:unnamed protein product [Eruca vesicaria subsp. sativa]|uniref:Uncharacterized protein n=1 Tax=Eruca vesicaria subsp. sativa TaxID=29727 RepID=A0ABC8INM8_ERUVS|nr:unnamed protein product [Eruca vesicaria subsp. sativa]
MWVLKAFGDMTTKNTEDPMRRTAKAQEDREDDPKKRSFKQASWYREPNVENTKLSPTQGKPQTGNHKPGNHRNLVRKDQRYGDDGDESEGRRGNPVKSRLGPRTDTILQAKKKNC